MVKENYVRVTKKVTFEMAHALDDTMGECANIHGHSYELQVTLIGLIKNGDKEKEMVIDFRELKKEINDAILNTFDHSFVLENTIPNKELKEKLTVLGYKKIILLPFSPTTENLLLHFVELLQSVLSKEKKLHSVRLQETANSFAEWYYNDQK